MSFPPAIGPALLHPIFIVGGEICVHLIGMVVRVRQRVVDVAGTQVRVLLDNLLDGHFVAEVLGHAGIESVHGAGEELQLVCGPLLEARIATFLGRLTLLTGEDE